MKLQEDVLENDVLMMGSSNVIGKTKSEMRTFLGINNALNIAVSSLAGTNLNYGTAELS